MTFQVTHAIDLADRLTSNNIPVPKPLERAVEIIRQCRANHPEPTRPILNLSDDEVIEHAKQLALHWATRGAVQNSIYVEALVALEDKAVAEAQTELQNGAAEDIIKALRPKFNAAAKILQDAIAAGITENTTADDIIDSPHPQAAALWRALPGSIQRLNEIHAIRVYLSQTLELAPTQDDFNFHAGSGSFDLNARRDYSVAYAEADNWTLDQDKISWLRMAAAGLRLNSFDETNTKLRTHRPAYRGPIDERSVKSRPLELVGESYR